MCWKTTQNKLLSFSEAAGADEQLSASGCVLSEEALLQRLSDG